MDKKDLSTELSLLEKRLFDENNQAPSHDLDQLILSAAHREMAQPQARTILKSSGWNKILLPLYVATGFAFTFIPVMFLWQAPVYNAQNDTERPVMVEFKQSVPSVNQKKFSPLTETSHHNERQLPEKLIIPTNLERTAVEKIMTNFELANIQVDSTQSFKPQSYTGTELKKALFPEKEAWARKIILFLKDDNIEQARLEIIQFKKINPEYPIEEQIKVLLM